MNDALPPYSKVFAPRSDPSVGFARSGSTSVAGSELDIALDLLRTTVEQLSQQRRVLNTAGLKARLMRETAGGFDEHRLGYTSFRAFLQDAVQRGIIELRRQQGADDYMVVPPGTSDSVVKAEEPTQLRDRLRIRRDLWRAFVEWRGGDTRLYDMERDVAVSFPSRPVPLEPGEITAMRQRWESNPEAFRAITPISIQTQLTWMRQFVDRATTGEVRELLLAALDSERPARAFVGILRSLPERADAWRRELTSRVLDVIRQWIASNNLDLDPLSSKEGSSAVAQVDSSKRTFSYESVKPAPGPPAAASSPATNEDAETALRRRLHGALDRMPLHELRQLRIPVGYFFDE